jgi:hypothetical protein
MRAENTYISEQTAHAERSGERHTQVRTEVPAIVGKNGNQPFAYLRRQLLELGKGESL